MEDGEGERNIGDDTHQARADAHVEAADALLSIDLAEAVPEAIVLVRVNTLHLSLDDINWVVCHRGAETCETTRQEIDHDRVGNIFAQSLFGIRENNEAHTLVRRLLHERGNDTLVAASGSLSLNNRVDAMEQVAVLWLG